MNKKILLCLSLFLLLSLFINIPFVNANPSYEDFTTYTEVEPSDRIQKNATQVNGTLKRNEDTYLYKDFGVDFFTDFVHEFDIYIDSSPNVCGRCGFVISQDLDDMRGLQDNSKTSMQVQFLYFGYGSSGYPKISLFETYSGTSEVSHMTNKIISTWYYMRLSKSGTDAQLHIWTNETDRDNFNKTGGGYDNATLTLRANHSFRYMMPVVSYRDGGAQIQVMHVKNLDLDFLTHFITFYFNEGGIFRVDSSTITNGTQIEYFNGTTLELASLTQNASYVWLNFTWLTYNVTTNPYNLIVISNSTLWCYFSPISALIDLTLPIALIISFGVICILLIIAKIKR